MLSLSIISTSCFVTHLPSCGRHFGNFTQRNNNKYFRSENISRIVNNVTRKECVLYCVTHTACHFINHKMDNSTCQLLTSYFGVMEEKPGWQFVSTDYSDWRTRGPLCTYLRSVDRISRPCQGSDIFCIDKCLTPGYECRKSRDVAFKKNAKASSYNISSASTPDRLPKYATHGGSTFFASAPGESKPWLLVDLEQRYAITHFNIKGHDIHVNPSNVMLLIGDFDERNIDGNDICIDNADASKRSFREYKCRHNIPMFGRYVVMTITDEAKTQIYVTFLRVYSLSEDDLLQ